NTTKLANGISYYEVIENGKATGKYINADNIDGTKRTLKHNAYVYKTSKKRANKVVLKKGTEVTTYGSPYTFKNGKKYYKIGADTKKTYVRVENFD
ncbi:surface layer protein, partial [Lactobacillus helveticus MTCC 5463]